MDLDYYSSTKDAFQIFSGDSNKYLPRIYCYFDDVSGKGHVTYNEYTGVLLAINEFNETDKFKKIAKLAGLIRRVPDSWNSRIYVCHDFKHPRYNDHLSPNIRGVTQT